MNDNHLWINRSFIVIDNEDNICENEDFGYISDSFYEEILAALQHALDIEIILRQEKINEQTRKFMSIL